MRNPKQNQYRTAMTLALFALLSISSIVLAQSGGDYTLDWWTVDNGGGTSAGGAYAVSATIGQPDAGVLMVGGQFGLQGGFWFAREASVSPPPSSHTIYLPQIVSE